MKFTLSWLKKFLDTKASLNQISEALTSLGLEVESITDHSKALEAFIIAEILEAEQHPNADRLKICKVNNGKQILNIVCGASNARAGIKVVLAEVGTILPDGTVIKQTKRKFRDLCYLGLEQFRFVKLLIFLLKENGTLKNQDESIYSQSFFFTK